MKKLISVLFIVGFCFTLTSTNAQTASSGTKSFSKKTSSPIDGAWQSVDHKGFVMMNEGFFSALGQDSTGIWRDTHAGTYTVDNANTITFKTLYSSEPTDMGGFMTVEYEMKGEALTIKFFKKVIDAKGADITAQLPKDVQVQYVRAQK